MRNNKFNTKGVSNVKFMDQPENSKDFDLGNAEIVFWDDDIPDDPFSFQVSEKEMNHINHNSLSRSEEDAVAEKGKGLVNQRLGQIAMLVNDIMSVQPNTRLD